MEMDMKKILIVSLFFSLCSPSANEGIVSLSDETTTTLIVTEEDYPIVLTQCLNEEHGYNIVTPFDIQDLKTTISQLSISKDEELQPGEDVNYCINKYNLWSDSSSQNPEEFKDNIKSHHRKGHHKSKGNKEVVEYLCIGFLPCPIHIY